jgi:hypothetical protein
MPNRRWAWIVGALGVAAMVAAGALLLVRRARRERVLAERRAVVEALDRIDGYHRCCESGWSGSSFETRCRDTLRALAVAGRTPLAVALDGDPVATRLAGCPAASVEMAAVLDGRHEVLACSARSTGEEYVSAVAALAREGRLARVLLAGACSKGASERLLRTLRFTWPRVCGSGCLMAVLELADRDKALVYHALEIAQDGAKTIRAEARELFFDADADGSRRARLAHLAGLAPGEGELIWAVAHRLDEALATSTDWKAVRTMPASGPSTLLWSLLGRADGEAGALAQVVSLWRSWRLLDDDEVAALLAPLRCGLRERIAENMDFTVSAVQPVVCPCPGAAASPLCACFSRR